MSHLAPLPRDQRKADADQLQLLAVFHFIIAGLSALGIGFLFLHYTFLHAILANPELWKDQKNAPPPAELFTIFKWFYVVIGVLIVASGIANAISGWCLQKKKHRFFSLIVAGLDCFQFPFGTVLGVFTFVVLLRDSVREIYAVGGHPTGDQLPPPL